MSEIKDVKYIAVAGNIGVGKTTLTKLLSKHFGWEAHYEDPENNPYMYDFYDDMPRWSFNLQVHFLQQRFKKVVEIQKGSLPVIQDRSIYEDAMIFAPNLHSMGLMSSRDFDTYTNLYNTIDSIVEAPDLLIYLKGSIGTLVNQIEKRGREYEETLRLDYLRRLNEHYNKWVEGYDKGKLLVIDVDECRFEQDQEGLGDIINRVVAELDGGLF